MSHFNSVVYGPKFTNFFCSNVEGVVDDVFFPTFDVTIRSEDNCDQNRKLSEIAPNFGRFFAFPNFRGGPSENGTHNIITPALGAARRLEKVSWGYSICTSPEVIVAHTSNFMPNFKFLRLIFFFLGGGGSPVPVGVCTSYSLGQSLTRV